MAVQSSVRVLQIRETCLVGKGSWENEEMVDGEMVVVHLWGLDLRPEAASCLCSVFQIGSRNIQKARADCWRADDSTLPTMIAQNHGDQVAGHGDEQGEVRGADADPTGEGVFEVGHGDCDLLDNMGALLFHDPFGFETARRWPTQLVHVLVHVDRASRIVVESDRSLQKVRGMDQEVEAVRSPVYVFRWVLRIRMAVASV